MKCIFFAEHILALLLAHKLRCNLVEDHARDVFEQESRHYEAVNDLLLSDLDALCQLLDGANCEYDCYVIMY